MKATEAELRERTMDVLRKCQQSSDTDAAHSIADQAICGLLESLGYGDVVKEYDKIEKWYA